MTLRGSASSRIILRLRSSALPPVMERKEIRERAGASLREMADALDVHPMTVWRWESGNATPRREAAVRYKALLDRLSELDR